MPDANAALMEAPSTAQAVAPRDQTGVVLGSGAMGAMLERIMLDPTLPMERVNQAFDFYMRVRSYEAKLAYDDALAAAQAEFPAIAKNRRVHFEAKSGGTTTDYRHEDLAEIVEKCGPILAKHGISHKWRTENPINEPIRVTCILTHRAGYSEETSLIGPRDESGNKNSLQGIASTVTYLERYTFKSAIGIASRHDDDGKAGGDAPPPANISEEQLGKLQLEIVDTNADLKKFCKTFKIESIDQLPASRFDEAMTALDRRRKAMQ